VGHGPRGHVLADGLRLRPAGSLMPKRTERAVSRAVSHRALRGNYAGASGDLSLGLGAGGKLLVGGSHHTISLQPLALQGQVGVNLALGVASLALR
jgi:Protein of unknown function (DUF992)